MTDYYGSPSPKWLSKLLDACEVGDTETVSSVLATKGLHSGAVDYKLSNEGECALFIAAKHGALNVVNILLRYGAKVNEKNGRQCWSALMVACQEQHHMVAQTLLEHGAIVNMQEKNGLSALMLGTQSGHVNIIKMLLEHGANVNLQNLSGSSALIFASNNGHTKAVKLLLEYGANISIKINDGWSALMLAAKGNHVEIVRLLLEHYANVDLQNNDGLSALMICISRKGDIEVIKLLLDHKANVNLQDKDGWSALMICSQYKNTELAKILLEHNARVNKKDINGWSALMIAALHEQTEVAELLLQYKANVNEQNIDGCSALMIATQTGHSNMIFLLLDHGADMSMKDRNGRSALMIASQHGYAESIRLMLTYVINITLGGTTNDLLDELVNTQDSNGTTALMIASSNGWTKVAELLLEYGANINERNNDGISAVMCAGIKRHIETVRLLLENGANLSTEEELSALMIASENAVMRTDISSLHDVIQSNAAQNRISTVSNDDSGYGSGQFFNMSLFQREYKFPEQPCYMPLKHHKLVAANTYSNTYNCLKDLELTPPPLPQKKRSTVKKTGVSYLDESEAETKPIPPIRKASLKPRGYRILIDESPPPLPIKKRASIRHKDKWKIDSTTYQPTCTKPIVTERTDPCNESEIPPVPPKKRSSTKSKGATASCTQQSVWFSEAEKNAHVPFLYHQVLECGYNGMEHTVDEHDITLRIPEGAVTKGEKLHIEIGVAMYGPFGFPKNTRPISPILWLCFMKEDIALKKDFQIILPHFLTELTIEKLHYHQVGFAKASHNQKCSTSDQISYEFKACESQSHFASSGLKSYGVLQSVHCCFYCLKANQSPELARNAGYCLARIESLSSEIFFVASFFLKSCVKAWKEQFPEDEGYRVSRCVDFKFKRGENCEPHVKICPHRQDQLDIALDPSGAEIRASEIDFWKEDLNLEMMSLKHDMKMYPPRVKMTVVARNRDYNIILPVQITGCSREGQLDMDLIIGLQSASPSSSSSSASGSILALLENRSTDISTQENKPKLRDIYRKLYPLATKWTDIGTLLGVDKSILDKIGKEKNRVHECLQEMLSEWLKQIDPLPTWKELIDTLEMVDPAKAREIADSLAQI